MASAGLSTLPANSKSLILPFTFTAPAPLSQLLPPPSNLPHHNLANQTTSTAPTISKPNATHFKHTKNRLHARIGQEKPKELSGAVLNDHYCFSKGDEYGVSRTEIMDAAYLFCVVDNPSDDPWDAFDFNEDDGRDVSRFGQDGGAGIEIAATLIDGCLVASDEDVQIMRDFTCYDIAFGAWDKCYGNGGRGGAIDVGCVRYSVRTYGRKFMDLSIADWDATEMDKDIIDGVDV